nr:hypothetical protein [Halomonas socia]
MKLVNVEIGGLPYEFTEDEAVELYTSLHAGLSSAGINVKKLKARSAAKRHSKMNRDGGDIAFFGQWPVQTDC